MLYELRLKCENSMPPAAKDRRPQIARDDNIMGRRRLHPRARKFKNNCNLVKQRRYPPYTQNSPFMSQYIRIVFSCLVISLVAVPGFSQENKQERDTTKPVKEAVEPDEDEEESDRSAGLKKIASGRSDRDIDVQIDEEAIESDVEIAVESAMESVEAVLENLVIDVEDVEVNIPNIDINMEPIEVILDDMEMDMDMDVDVDVDMDMDHDDISWDEDDDDDDSSFISGDDKDKNKQKEKDKQKDKVKDKSEKEKNKSDKSDNDKSKGLKKLN
jgi:hypothetical protein